MGIFPHSCKWMLPGESHDYSLNRTTPKPPVFEEVKVKQVSSLSRSVPLPYNSPESENQPRSGQRVCLGRDDDCIGSDFMGFCMFYVANTFALLCKGEKTKQNSIPGRDLSHTIWEENVAKGLHFPTVWNLNGKLMLVDDRIYVPEASLPRCGALLKRLTELSHSTRADPKWDFPPQWPGQSLHRAPKSTGPRTFWKATLSVFFPSQGCLSQSLGFRLSTMDMKTSTYPHRTARLNKIIHAMCLLEGMAMRPYYKLLDGRNNVRFDWHNL